MSESRVEEIVRKAVAQVLDRQLPSLRETLVQEVLREVGPELAGKSQSPGSAASLQKAISAIQSGTTQKEILRALLDNTVLYSGRAALFVVKNGAATGWQGSSFSDDIKDFALDTACPLVAKVLKSHTAESGHATDLDQNFNAKFGAPAGEAVLLPLLLKDKVSALVYADGGAEGAQVDSSALDVLVRATSAWLEVIAQRKQAQKDGTPDPEMHVGPAANDPFSAHSPVHSRAQSEPAPAAAMSAAAAWGGAPTTIPSGEDGEIHRKAQRFARLLIDELKLYNQAKVAEGRKHKDLYNRLKEDIEKSRATYQKRYGNSPAASGDYFSQELIRSLAEDDVSLLGSNFQR